MTRSKGNLPSLRGLKGKIFNGKVIGLFIIFFISIFFIFTTISYIGMKTGNSDNIVEAKELSYETKIVDEYARKLEKEQGYEEVIYQLNKIVELSEQSHIPYKITFDIDDSLEDIFIKRYDYFVKYYKTQVHDKVYLFKNQTECDNFIQNISQYDNQEYVIETTREMVNRETSEEEVNSIIEIKKQEYEEAQAKAAAEAEAKRLAEEKARQEAEQEQTTTNYTYSSSSYSLSDLQAYAYDLVINQYGWSEYDFQCLVNLWNRESGWNPNAHNSYSGAHGIPQSLPASKMASEGADYYTNGETQIRWGLKYILGRYGSPSAAWAHSQSTGWY